MQKRKPKKLTGINSKIDRSRSNQLFKEMFKRAENRTGKKIKRLPAKAGRFGIN